MIARNRKSSVSFTHLGGNVVMSAKSMKKRRKEARELQWAAQQAAAGQERGPVAGDKEKKEPVLVAN
jgi:hypothetical protein